MALTVNEHARILRRTLKNAERALAEHHEALACFARDCGRDLGVDDDIIAAAQKGPPPNDGGG